MTQPVKQPAAVKPSPVSKLPSMQRQCGCGKHSHGEGECAECREKREMLQRKPLSPTPYLFQGEGIEDRGTGGSAPPIVHEVLRSPGQPLDADTRAFMEPRFGQEFSRVRVSQVAQKKPNVLAIGPAGDRYEQEADRISGQVTHGMDRAVLPGSDSPRIDFSQVRFHISSQAARSARAVNALAYTVGQQIVFGAGQYAPGTFAGRSLIAHELTHTLQQSTGKQANLVQRQGFGELRVAEGLSEERTREQQARSQLRGPVNMAGRILTDIDIEHATRAAPGAAAPTRITPGIRGARFVLHDTASPVGATRISEHQQHGRRSSGEGAGAWVPRGTPAVITHQPFFDPRRPAATQFERGQDVMVKATREKEYRAVWSATAQSRREAALDEVLRAQGSPPDEATSERSTAIRELAATSGDVHSAGAWAVEDICRAVSNQGSASIASSPQAAPNLEGACQRLAPLFSARAARIGSTVNVEIVQERGSDCRTSGTLTPLQPYTDAQYTNVVQVYLRAALEARFFPEITTHFLLDRGVGDHCDPRCFNLTRLYREIAVALGHPPGSTYGITPVYGTNATDNVWWNNQICGGSHP